MISIYSEKYFDEIEKTVKGVLKRFDTDENAVSVEISIVSEEEIRALNAETRGKDSVTDVLSFQNVEDIRLPVIPEEYKGPEMINYEDNSVILGEICICEQRAKEQAEEYGHSLKREIAFLTCHGMLHLLGFDHQTPEEEREMTEYAEEILTSVGYTREDASEEEEIETEDKENKKEFHSGFVAILGRPNAGKSTLINTIVGEKVSIVSWKPQTTRNRILGIYNEENYQIIFIDTPGLHKPRNSLGEYMMKSAKIATEGVDCLLYVIDAEKGYDESDRTRLLSYTNEGEKVIAVVNKTDHVTKEKVLGILNELNKLEKLTAVVPTSALRKRNIEPLIAEIKKLLSDSIKYYPDEQYTDRNMRFMTAEIIREKALRLLDKEVPYGIGVDVRSYDVKEDGSLISIDADIVCEKAAHKPIIVGKGGAMIKKISTYARQDLEDMTGTKVFLNLFVKVKDEWRGSQLVMKELGYDPKNPD